MIKKQIDYYIKNEIDSKFRSYYTKAETDTKIENGGGGCKVQYSVLGHCDSDSLCSAHAWDGARWDSPSSAASAMLSGVGYLDVSCIQEVVCSGQVVKRTSIWYQSVFNSYLANNLRSRTCP